MIQLGDARRIRLLLAASMFNIALGAAPQRAFAQAGPTSVKPGTIVVVKLDEAVSGKTHKPGASVGMSVARDVVVSDVKVVAAGTPVVATISLAEESGMVGQSGSISFNVESTTTVDGQQVFLRGVFTSEGQGKVGTSVAISVILCPLALLMKGKEGNFAAGTEFKTNTQNEVTVQPKP